MTTLHNWQTIEELVKAEKRQFKPKRKWRATRILYIRTGKAWDTYVDDLIPYIKRRLVRDHVRPCV